jgi:hypothetical protein
MGAKRKRREKKSYGVRALFGALDIVRVGEEGEEPPRTPTA